MWHGEAMVGGGSRSAFLLRCTRGAIIWAFLTAGCGPEIDPDLPTTLAAGVVEAASDPTDPQDGQLTLSFEATPEFCCDPLSIEFSASLSAGRLDRNARFEWEFGDGRTGSGAFIPHTYPWAGTYSVVLTAHLTNGAQMKEERLLHLQIDDLDRAEVSLSSPPSPGTGAASFTLSAGIDQTVRSGDRVTLTARVETESPAPIQFTWRQTAGSSVELHNPTTAAAWFIAPNVAQSPRSLSFAVAATDGQSTVEDQVSVSVLRSGTAGDNDPPVVSDMQVVVLPNEPARITLTGSDLDEDALTFTIVDPPAHGRAVAVGADRSDQTIVIYIPTADFIGADAFRYQADDGRDLSNIATVTIDVRSSGSEPEVFAASFFAPVDTAVRLALEASDAGNADLTFTVASGPRHGAVGAIESRGRRSASLIYTPVPGFRGTDTFTVSANNGHAASPPATVTVRVAKKPVPWLELNSNPLGQVSELGVGQPQGSQTGWTVLDYFLAGLQHWAEVTDLAIVTTSRLRLDRQDLFPLLMHQRPPTVRIIGGLKSSEFVPGAAPFVAANYDFADPAAWRIIADHARAIVQATGANVVVLENETAVRPYHEGRATIDYQRLTSSLAPLAATGIEFWWYLPQIGYNIPEFPDRLAQTTQFVDAVNQALPTCRFITLYTSFSRWRGHSLVEPYRNAMIEHVGLPRMNEMLYVTESGYINDRYYYQPAELIPQLDNVLPVGNLNVVYPGLRDWILVAENFTSLLPPLADTTPND